MKQLRKDDGYILVYVLVVFLVLSFAAVAICTGAVQNLRAQQASIERTQALYEAEGQIEHFVALLNEMEARAPVSAGDSDATAAAAKTAFWNDLTTLDGNLPQIQVDSASTLDSLVVQSVSADGTAKIDAELRVHLKLDVHAVPPADPSLPVSSYTCTYTMSQDAVYQSYDISYSTGGDAG